MSSFARGRAAGGAIFLGLILLYFVGSSLVRLTADEHGGDFSLWIHDGDAAVGGKIAARVKNDGFGGRAPSVTVHLAGGRRYYASDDSDVLDFDIIVPDRAVAGEDYAVTIDVTEHVQFVRTFHVYTPTMSMVRRAVRGGAALVIALAMALVLRMLTRFHFRRGWKASLVWYLLAAPHVVLGYYGFSRLIAGAIGIHSLWFHSAAILVWLGLLLVPGRTKLRRGLPRYVATPAVIATEQAEPYRTSRVPEVIESADNLATAWSAAGLLVQRRRSELVITKRHVGSAVVPIAPGETFGGGEPFEVFTNSREMADTILQAAANVLGPLRSTIPDATDQLVFERQR